MTAASTSELLAQGQDDTADGPGGPQQLRDRDREDRVSDRSRFRRAMSATASRIGRISSIKPSITHGDRIRRNGKSLRRADGQAPIEDKKATADPAKERDPSAMQRPRQEVRPKGIGAEQVATRTAWSGAHDRVLTRTGSDPVVPSSGAAMAARHDGDRMSPPRRPWDAGEGSSNPARPCIAPVFDDAPSVRISDGSGDCLISAACGMINIGSSDQRACRRGPLRGSRARRQTKGAGADPLDHTGIVAPEDGIDRQTSKAEWRTRFRSQPHRR